MKDLQTLQKSYLVFLTFSLLFLAYCSESHDPVSPNLNRIQHESGNYFAGAETCRPCHKKIFDQCLDNAHHKTSSHANKQTVKGSFEPERNTLDLESVSFEMLDMNDSLFVSAAIKNRNVEIPTTSFDVVIGSGRKGQSYFSWSGDALFQIQPSYYSAMDLWINSPGYKAFYTERPITTDCIKCHFTYATEKIDTPPNNIYRKSELIFGVSCERCHGPAAKHLDFHRKNPKSQNPKHISVLRELPNARKIDICAQCHAGLRERTIKGNGFSFLPGDKLADYSQNVDVDLNRNDLDVHGNQVGLMMQSACFKQTQNMNCITCHDPHQNQKGNLSHFDAKCRECHQGGKMCTESLANKSKIADSCVQCHMPKTPSYSMLANIPGHDTLTPFYIRNHRIAVYR